MKKPEAENYIRLEVLNILDEYFSKEFSNFSDDMDASAQDWFEDFMDYFPGNKGD